MKRSVTLGIVLVGLAGLASSASAALIFSNVNISGSIAGTPTVTTGVSDIDFAFGASSGTVGDPVTPLRSGNIVITFDVLSTSGAITTDFASILGAATGSGMIIFNEVVEDIATGRILALRSLIINASNPPPQNMEIPFSQGSTNFKVKKTFFLFAPDTQATDIANVSLVEQRFVPTPGSLALLGLGGLVASRRRR